MQFSSNILAEARGSLNGTVFSRNRAGAYTRGRTKPINPSTDKQAAVRLNFANVSQAWAGLTLANATSWNEFAQTQTRLNKLGQPYTPNGRQLFMEFNTNLQVVGEAIILTPPVNPTSPAYLAEDFTFNVTELAGAYDAIGYDGPTLTGDDVVVIQASAPLLASRTSTKVPFKEMGSTTGVDLDMKATYEAIFGPTATAGRIIHFRYRIQNAEGISSSWTYKSEAIEAVGP